MAQQPAKRGLSVPVPATKEEWERLLALAATGDRQAGEITRKLNKSSAAFPGFLSMVFTSAHEEIRQLAAILVRQHVAGHWGKFKEPQHKQWQQQLLEHLLREPRYERVYLSSSAERYTQSACSQIHLSPDRSHCSLDDARRTVARAIAIPISVLPEPSA